MEKLQSQKLEIHSFIAAFIGGYFIWGNYNKVNEQVSSIKFYIQYLTNALVTLMYSRTRFERPRRISAENGRK